MKRPLRVGSQNIDAEAVIEQSADDDYGRHKEDETR
jgi:hypothetical protein